MVARKELFGKRSQRHRICFVAFALEVQQVRKAYPVPRIYGTFANASHSAGYITFVVSTP